MQRGNLILSQPHIELLLNHSFLENQFISQKLQSAAQSASDTTVELSEDEAEILLDALPIPSLVEPPLITELRERIQEFLTNLR